MAIEKAAPRPPSPRSLAEMLERAATSLWFTELPFRCSVQLGNEKLCVITGPNTSGKSLLRKILHNHVADMDKIEYMHLSQEGRSTPGIQRAFLYGSEMEDSTGCCSVKTLFGLFRTGEKRTEPFVVMYDEPEIGCGEEVQLAIGQKIVEKIDTMPKMVAFFVVTHSRILARALMPLNPTHVRLGGDNMTLEAWANREVVAADLDEVMKNGIEGWRAVRAILDDKKKR